MHSEILPLLFIFALFFFLFPNVLPMIFCNAKEARPGCKFQFYRLGSRAALKEFSLSFISLICTMETNKCSVYLSPRVPGLKGKEMDVTALSYFRKRPYHHPNYKLHPASNSSSRRRGIGVSNLSRPSPGDRGDSGAGEGPQPHSRAAEDPMLLHAQMQAWEKEAPEPKRVEIPEGPQIPSHPWPRSHLASPNSRRPRGELGVLIHQHPRRRPIPQPWPAVRQVRASGRRGQAQEKRKRASLQPAGGNDVSEGAKHREVDAVSVATLGG